MFAQAHTAWTRAYLWSTMQSRKLLQDRNGSQQDSRHSSSMDSDDEQCHASRRPFASLRLSDDQPTATWSASIQRRWVRVYTLFDVCEAIRESGRLDYGS